MIFLRAVHVHFFLPALLMCAIYIFLSCFIAHLIFYLFSFDHTAFRQQIDMYKQLSPIIRWGDIYRLWDPFKVRKMLDCAIFPSFVALLDYLCHFQAK